MFGRATITLGIGPHSSLYFIFRVNDSAIVIYSPGCNMSINRFGLI